MERKDSTVRGVDKLIPVDVEERPPAVDHYREAGSKVYLYHRVDSSDEDYRLYNSCFLSSSTAHLLIEDACDEDYDSPC